MRRGGGRVGGGRYEERWSDERGRIEGVKRDGDGGV